MDRVAAVQLALEEVIASAPAADSRLASDAPLIPEGSLTAGQALELFEDQVRSRALDVAARELKGQGKGYYTISSAGHEDNAVLGALLRPTDVCFLHYRSGALMMAHSRKDPASDPMREIMLSFMASREDPASGGRHKVWGSRPLWVPPQTSTIGSHLPKAVGTAFAIGRRGRLGVDGEVPADAVAMCSFGDASFNQAASIAAVNAARWAHRVGNRLPMVFVCEDNGIGISVATPKGWIESSVRSQPGLHYVRAAGEIDEVWAAAEHAIDRARSRGVPVFLHLETVRLWGHAGSDLESAYRPRAEILESETRDPIARLARRLLARGAADRGQLQQIMATARARTVELMAEVIDTENLTSFDEIVAPLAPHRVSETTAESARDLPGEGARLEVHARQRLPEHATNPAERTLAARINATLRDELLHRPNAAIFGEDVGRKGGVYGLTTGLQAQFGIGRVFDTLLDETSILGLAQGVGLIGGLPVPEIQYLAYLHNALDQLRGEACSTSFFSNGEFTTPMVVRVAGLAYQKGFGGHFHNDNSVGALRDIPGLIVAVPSRGDDAAQMLRGCLAMAATDGRVVVFLEPIALYHERDLYEPGDGGWLTDYPLPGEALLPGEVGIYNEDATDVLIVTYGNGVRMALRASKRLAAEGVGARVLDLRWLAPLPMDAVAEHASACGAVLVADECRESGGGIADAAIAGLSERGMVGPLRSVRSKDTYVPLGPAADVVLLSEDDIVVAAAALVEALDAPSHRPDQGASRQVGAQAGPLKRFVSALRGR